jgi:hypothetical protein
MLFLCCVVRGQRCEEVFLARIARMTRIFRLNRQGAKGAFGWVILILEEGFRIKIPNRWREIKDSVLKGTIL